MDIDLESLVGEHFLSGTFFDERGGRAVLRFTLDGQHYEAEEDPDDGYRSYLGSIRTSDIAPENPFPEAKVVGVMKDSGILQFLNHGSKKPILEIGTDDSDSYYPSFVGYFSPENL